MILVELFLLMLFTKDFALVHSAESAAPLQFTEEPSDIQFSSKTSAHLHCSAVATSSYASDNQILISWRFGNGSLVGNIPDILQTLPNGTLLFKPFKILVPGVHRAKFQCLANLTLNNQAILSRPALVHGVIVKSFRVSVADQYVYGAGETATFTCLYPPDVSSYVQIRSWFADREKTKPSQNLVIHDVQREHSTKLYYCIVVNILTKEIVASNVARLFIKDASDAQNVPFKFNIIPDADMTAVQNQMVLFQCLASRTRNVEYVWKHNNKKINFDSRYSMVNSRSLRIIKTIVKDSGKYTCIARDKSTNEEISVNSTLLVRVPLVFLTGPSKICKTYLVNATFPCEVAGYPPPKITWYKNAKEITKKNNYNAVRKGDDLIITSVWGKNEGIYQCIASNGLETIHRAASLIVGAEAPRITESFKAENVTLYAKLDISCKATGGKEQAKLFWYRDGILIKKSSDRRIHLKHYNDLWTLQIKNVTAADSGMYKCKAMNRAGSNFSEARILVKGPAKVIYVPKNVIGLSGKDVSITCRANGFPRAEIVWFDNNGGVAPQGFRQEVVSIKDGESTLTIKGLQQGHDNGQYTCKASSKLGSPDYASVNLSVYGAPQESYRLHIMDEGLSKLNFLCSDRCIKWTKNGKIVKESARTTVKRIGDICLLRLNGISMSEAGNYTCHKQTEYGIHKETQEILVITRPRFINPHSPNTTDVLEHKNAQLACYGAGFPTPRTIWRRLERGSYEKVKDSSRFVLTNNGSLTILNASAEDETYYSCEIKNAHTFSPHLTIKLNVNVPARIVNWISTVLVDAGNITRLTCEVTGDKMLNFTWIKDRRKILRSSNIIIEQYQKESKSSLTILSTAATYRGKYMCKVANSFGKDEKTLTLEIRERPYPPRLYRNSIIKTKTSITISWNASFDGNSEILSYEIEYRVSTYQSRRAIVAITAEKNSYTITGLEPYTSYKISVRARNALGLSGSSDIADVDTEEDVPSAAPNLTLVPSDNSIRIKWKTLSVKVANGVIKGYIVWYKINSSHSAFAKKMVKLIDGRKTTIHSLKPYTYYIVKMQAFTSAGRGPNSSIVTTRTLEGVPSKPPTNITVISKTSTSIFLSWLAPSKESIHGILVGYHVCYDDRRNAMKCRASGNETNFMLTNLRKYTYYTITVAAYTVKGPGISSKPVNILTDEDVPGPPKDLNAVTTSVHSIKLTWSKPDEPNGRIIHYKVYYVTNDDGHHKQSNYNIIHVDGTRTSHEFEKLKENRTYYFRVCAKTSKGEGNCTEDVMATTSRGPPSFTDSHSGDVTAKWKTKVRLRCSYSGFPEPKIKWLDSKEKPIDVTNSDKYHVTMEGHLVIHDLNRKDSKRYVCMVANKWGSIKKGITLKVQAPPDPPQNIEFFGINSTAVKILWSNGFNGNSIITGFLLKYQRRIDLKWKAERLGYSNEFIMNNVDSGKSYEFKIRARNDIGPGNFTKPKVMIFVEGAILKPVEGEDVESEVETKSSKKTIFKDSAVLGTLIGVSLFIIIVIVTLVLLTKLGYNPGSKLAQRSVEAWRWFVAKGISAKDRRRNVKRRSGGSSTDGHLGGSSSSLSQEPASNNGSTFSLPQSSGRVTESGYATSGYPPPPFSNYTPGPNGGARASGSSDEGIGPETRSEIHTRPGTGDKEYHQPYLPPRSSNGTPAPPTLMMSSREYIDPEEIEHRTISMKGQIDEEHKIDDIKSNESEDISPETSPKGKERIYFQSMGHCFPLNMSPGRPKYDDGHFIIAPDVDRILAYRPPRCYDSTSSEYSSSRDELAQAYEFGKLHHLDDFYGRPTLESASSSGETASSEKDGICHFTSELSVGRPFFIPVAILPPPPNQRLRTRDRKRNPHGQQLNTYYEKDETLV
ncbi:Down syndrome cell adhesion molecule-like protein 1 homolog isoform X2 [Dendronephthya gigantea]|uniref:Down syndrome cell adhesion molecule-like protein 1 homolog isoform X2 n=1 Tax=Dendronephthya gigantea TaxID=151771 RepID=UPI00106AC548|nr:Down syndrome cell adhesion molecule-like protein 1 homolog isoform X2 [Dendronephthya gigantea]